MDLVAATNGGRGAWAFAGFAFCSGLMFGCADADPSLDGDVGMSSDAVTQSFAVRCLPQVATYFGGGSSFGYGSGLVADGSGFACPHVAGWEGTLRSKLCVYDRQPGEADSLSPNEVVAELEALGATFVINTCDQPMQAVELMDEPVEFGQAAMLSSPNELALVVEDKPPLPGGQGGIDYGWGLKEANHLFLLASPSGASLNTQIVLHLSNQPFAQASATGFSGSVNYSIPAANNLYAVWVPISNSVKSALLTWKVAGNDNEMQVPLY